MSLTSIVSGQLCSCEVFGEKAARIADLFRSTLSHIERTVEPALHHNNKTVYEYFDERWSRSIHLIANCVHILGLHF